VKKCLAAGLVFVFAVLNVLAIDSNEKLNYQGKLLSGTNLINGIATNVFRLYDASVGGTLLYSQTQSVAVVDGLYTTTIGDSGITPSLSEALTNFSVYIEVEVNGTILLPRERIYQAAYALTAVRRDGDCMTAPLGINAGGNGDLVITNSGDGIMLGNGAHGQRMGTALGFNSLGNATGVAVGAYADGSQSGAAVGYDANGYWYGAALGAAANGNVNGVAVGFNANGNNGGVAAGRNARALGAGVAVGNTAAGDNVGVAIGNGANGSQTNIAIGWSAKASTGSKRIAIGVSTTNEIDNSAVIRGTLYLDGSTGVYYRSTFGNGAWAVLGDTSTNYVQKKGDTMSGLLSISNALRVYTEQNRVATVRPMLIIGGGEDVEIGSGANGYFGGAAVGFIANGYSGGAALGYGARAQNSAVGIGHTANGMDYGVAIGSDALGTNYGVSVGRSSEGTDNGAALGYNANAINYGAAVGSDAGGRNRGAALGSTAAGYDYGVGVGNGAQGSSYGVAIGAGSSGGSSGTAVGASSVGYNGGLAVGAQANGTWGNMAVGQQAHAGSGFNRTAVGPQVTNVADNSVALRGTLYLDGATGILYRTAFGSGGWSNMLGNFVESDPRWTAASNSVQTQLNAKLASNVWAAAGATTNYVRRTGDTMTGAFTINVGSAKEMVIDSLGTNVAIGQSANGWGNAVAVGAFANGYFGAAVGTLANAYWYGAALGHSATAKSYSVAIGEGSLSWSNGVAIGFVANGNIYGTAVGAGANGFDFGAALGYGAIGRNHGVAMGADAESSRTNIAIGASANAMLGAERIAIGHKVTNRVDNSAAVRGTLYLDGGTGIMTRATFGTGNWTNYPQWTWVTAITNMIVQKQTVSPFAVTNIITQTGQLKVLR